MSLRARVLLLLALVACAGGVFFAFTRGERAGHQSIVRTQQVKGGEHGRKWFEEYKPFWNSLQYVPLNDANAVREAARGLVAARVGTLPIDDAALTRDLAAFLYALGADTWEEYLARLSPKRVLRSDLYADVQINGWYRYLTNAPMPASITASEMFRRLWRGVPGAIGRPALVSTRGLVSTALSKPGPEQPDPSMPFVSLVVPHFPVWDLSDTETDPWIAGFVEQLPRLTDANTTLETAVRAGGQIPMCAVHVAVESADGERLIMPMWFFYVRSDAAWHVAFVGDYTIFLLSWPF